MGNRFGKFKRGVEDNSGLYLFSRNTPNKEIPHIFNLTTPKENLMQILYKYDICKAEIYHSKYIGSNIQFMLHIHRLVVAIQILA